jgi:mannonate dehydratase
MRIRSADVIVTSPGRNFVTLKLTTDEGLTGLGDATLNGREMAVAAYLGEHVAPLLIGRDAHRIEDAWQYLYRGAYWRRGPVTMAAIGAVDVALWDIKGKAAGLPLYQLLGGAARDRVLAYAHATGREIGELLESIDAQLALGYRAVRVQTGVPGLDTAYGIAGSAASGAYEPAGRQAKPAEETWDAARYMRHIPGVLDRVRERFGPELLLLHDVHHRLTPIQAARLGRDLETFDLFWLEDVTPAENQEALRLVRMHTTTPLAIGEVFNTIWDADRIIREQLADYIRTCVAHGAG